MSDFKNAMYMLCIKFIKKVSHDLKKLVKKLLEKDTLLKLTFLFSKLIIPLIYF